MSSEPRIMAELKRAEFLKPEIREKYKLPETGLIIKITTRFSPAEFNYIAIQNTFSEYLKNQVNSIDMSRFIDEVRQQI